MLINKLIQSLDRGDVRTFLFFMGISGLLWLLGNLSERYDARAAFRLELINCPDSLGIYREDPPVIYARLRTSGFRFLTGSYGGRGVEVDLARVQESGKRYFVLRSQMSNMINRKLPQEVELLSVEQDSFYMPVYRKEQKEIEVRADVDFDLEPNHRISGGLELTPSSVVAEGPKAELEKLSAVYTQPVKLGRVSGDINQIASVILPGELMNVTLSATTIRIFGRVKKFSEAIYQVPVAVENPPAGFRVRLLPREVQVVCQADQERLKQIRASDFRVMARFSADSIAHTAKRKLPLSIVGQPDSVYLVRLVENEVSYFLEKEN